jgi:hypothetical protein
MNISLNSFQTNFLNIVVSNTMSEKNDKVAVD